MANPAWGRTHVGTLTRVMRFFIDVANTGDPADTKYATPGDIETMLGGAPGGEWETTPTLGTGNTYFQLSRPNFTRSGKADVAEGDVVTLTQRIELTVTSGNLPSITFDNLPVAAKTDGGYPFPLRTIVSHIHARLVGGTLFSETEEWDAVFVDSGTKVHLTNANATAENTTFEISMTCIYTARGPG